MFLFALKNCSISYRFLEAVARVIEILLQTKSFIIKFIIFHLLKHKEGKSSESGSAHMYYLCNLWDTWGNSFSG